MAFRVEIDRTYLDKALEAAAASAIRASNAKGVNPLIKDIHLKDAKVYNEARTSVTEVK